MKSRKPEDYSPLANNDYVGKISAIVQTEDPEVYRVNFSIINVADFIDKQGNPMVGMKQDDLHLRDQEMIISIKDDACTMSPEGDLKICMDYYHEHKSCSTLNIELNRQWKTAFIADSIADCIISSSLLGLWVSGD